MFQVDSIFCVSFTKCSLHCDISQLVPFGRDIGRLIGSIRLCLGEGEYYLSSMQTCPMNHHSLFLQRVDLAFPESSLYRASSLQGWLVSRASRSQYHIVPIRSPFVCPVSGCHPGCYRYSSLHACLAYQTPENLPFPGVRLSLSPDN